MKYTDEYLAKAGKLTTMGDLNNRIAKLEEKAPTTPINLSELEARVTYLEQTAKKWEVVTLTRSGYSFPYNAKYKGWNWVVIGGELATRGRNRVCTFRNDGVRCYTTLRNDIDEYFTYYNNGSAIVQSGNDRYSDSKGNITVLFYK